MDKENTSWKSLIAEYKFKSCTCSLHQQQFSDANNTDNKLCSCGRMIRCHSFTGKFIETEEMDKKNTRLKSPNKTKHEENGTARIPIDVCGTLQSGGCKFLRVHFETSRQKLYNLMCEDCKEKPDLILSVYGGAKYFKMTEKLKKELIRGIINAAITATSK